MKRRNKSPPPRGGFFNKQKISPSLSEHADRRKTRKRFPLRSAKWGTAAAGGGGVVCYNKQTMPMIKPGHIIRARANSARTQHAVRNSAVEQKVVDNKYIADFFSAELNLIIEIHGVSHDNDKLGYALGEG